MADLVLDPNTLPLDDKITLIGAMMNSLLNKGARKVVYLLVATYATGDDNEASMICNIDPAAIPTMLRELADKFDAGDMEQTEERDEIILPGNSTIN